MSAPPVAKGAPTPLATRLYVNLPMADQAEAVAARPVDGVGLLRSEFMIATGSVAITAAAWDSSFEAWSSPAAWMILARFSRSASACQISGAMPGIGTTTTALV